MKPLDVDEAFINGSFGVWPEDRDRDGALGSLAKALEGVIETWVKIRTRYRESLLDLTAMPLARVKAAYKLASEQMDATLRRVDSALQAANAELAELTRKHTPRPGGVADTMLEGEVRAHLRHLDEGSRLAALQEAARTGDLVTLRAALLAPPILLPLHPELREMALQAYARATDPEGLDRRAQLQAGLKQVTRAAQVLMSLVNRLLPPEVGQSASNDRRAAMTAERLIDKEGKLALAEQNTAPPEMQFLRGVGMVEAN